MTYFIDTSQSPLYVLHFDAHLSLAQTQRLLADVDKLLARPGKFGVVMNNKIKEANDDDFEKDFDGELDEDDHDHDHKHSHEPGVARTHKAWLTANRDRFAQDCVGLAMVSANSKFVSFYAPFANRIIGRMYRCPGAVFSDHDKALAWVQARMPQSVE
ncbi:MAG TPA: hypothetical protein PKM78_12455 [Anaerolineae bacterium]|nr:hypothetical protein [Anaerolineae bacterium]HNU03685.1 hypothetical protein [Anaerolineae bacterium]